MSEWNFSSSDRTFVLKARAINYGFGQGLFIVIACNTLYVLFHFNLHIMTSRQLRNYELQIVYFAKIGYWPISNDCLVITRYSNWINNLQNMNFWLPWEPSTTIFASIAFILSPNRTVLSHLMSTTNYRNQIILRSCNCTLAYPIIALSHLIQPYLCACVFQLL